MQFLSFVFVSIKMLIHLAVLLLDTIISLVFPLSSSTLFFFFYFDPYPYLLNSKCAFIYTCKGVAQFLHLWVSD